MKYCKHQVPGAYTVQGTFGKHQGHTAVHSCMYLEQYRYLVNKCIFIYVDVQQCQCQYVLRVTTKKSPILNSLQHKINNTIFFFFLHIYLLNLHTENPPKKGKYPEIWDFFCKIGVKKFCNYSYQYHHIKIYIFFARKQILFVDSPSML